MRITRYLLLIVLVTWSYASYAQEVRGLNYNPVLKKAAKAKSLKTAAPQDTIVIPKPDGNIFFDDFCLYGSRLFPESTNWIDRNATVTRSFSDSAISLGVITLDCFDSEGKVYGPANRVNASDTLTSCKIDSIVDDSLVMSFFIQGGGKVDPPETKDSLRLEFLLNANDTSIWLWAWSSPGFDSSRFKQIIIPIADSLVADSCFQFRFINFTSLSKSEVIGNEGAMSNADNWHIDYIQIKTNTDSLAMTVLDDITVTEPLLPVFSEYSVIPYSHIQYSAGYYRGTNTINYATFFPNIVDDISVNRYHIYSDITNDEILSTVGLGTGIQVDVEPVGYNQSSDIFFPRFKVGSHPNQIMGEFQLKSYISPTGIDNQYLWNDTVTRQEIYMDYYAYDDGTAEFGFGITGADTEGAAFATLHDIYHLNGVPDTLSGMYIYFNHAMNDFTADLGFRVAVWDVINGEPGNILYISPEDSLYTPNQDKGLNDPTTGIRDFMRINFPDILVPKTFFIGILQYTNEFLNVGYDISLNTKAKTMYYSDNEWHSTTKVPNIPNGSLMIRPIFDHQPYPTSIRSVVSDRSLNIEIYPNPAREFINLHIVDDNLENFEYRIYNILGKEIQSDKLTGNTIDISGLSSGVFILQVQNRLTRQTYSQKLLKTAY